MRRLITAISMMTLAVGAGAAPYVGGFVEGAHAMRLYSNPAIDGGLSFGYRDYPRSEMRAQLKISDGMDDAEYFLRIDLLSDATRPGGERASVDLREAYLKLYPTDWLELKLGRQVATWGTGDFVFANDLFAKSWQAFFTGLDDAYLKPPQDLLRATAFFGGKTAEIAWSPRFTPDTLPDGSRLSMYNPFTGTLAAGTAMPGVLAPPGGAKNGELYARLFGSSGSYEWALYGYKGFWPTPQGVVMTAGTPNLGYPELASTGASLRGPLGSYLASAELAAYFSTDDGDGDNPLVANSEIRAILGLEKSLGNDWSVSGQYYGIRMMDYDGYEAGLQPGQPVFDEIRSTLTARVNKFALDQKLQLSMFAFLGVTDGDWHLRPAVAWKLTDAVKWTTGASLIGADDLHTTFGQFDDNSSLFTRIRYSF